MFKKLAALLATVLVSTQVFGQATLLPNAKQTFVDINGAPLASGTIDFYIPNTNTRKTTWTNAAESSMNTNPVVLDAAGRALIYGQGSYRQVVKDALGNTQWDAVTAAPSSGTSTFLTDAAPVGTMLSYAGLTLPTNYLWAYGQALNRTTYATLKTALTIVQNGTSVLGNTTVSGMSDTSQIKAGAAIEGACLSAGTTVATVVNAVSITVSAVATATGTCSLTVYPYGNGNGSTTFNAPDMRGRSPVGRDNIGGTAAAVLTTAFYGASPDALGVAGGAQSQTLVTGNLPAYTPAGTNAAHTHFIVNADSSTGALTATNQLTSARNSGDAFSYNLSGTTTAATIGLSSSTTTVFTGTAQGGVSTAFSRIQPSLTLNYIIKYQESIPSGGGGVISLGGMTGDILCGAGTTCTGNVLSVAGAGTGDVIGPASAADSDVVLFDGTTGKLIKGSAGVIPNYMNFTGGSVFNPSLSITPPTGTLTQALFTNQLNVAGTVANEYYINRILIQNDAIDAGNLPTSRVYGFGVTHVLNNATVRGERFALFGEMRVLATTSPLTPDANRSYVASVGYASTAVNDNGISGTPKGLLSGGNFNVIMTSGATFWQGIIGAELDVTVATGASVAQKYGLTIVQSSSDRVAGSSTDHAISIYGASASNPGWTCVLCIDSTNGSKVMSATGAVMGSVGAHTALSVFDFQTMAVTYLIRGPNNFTINGSGDITGRNVVPFNNLGASLGTPGTNVWNGAYINTIFVGLPGTSTGTALFQGATSGAVTMQSQAVAGTYNLNLPTTAGSSGQVLTSAGGGAAAMTWTTPATGTVTSIATTSPITGGTITTTGTIACATCVTSAASLTSNSLMIGAGSQASAVTTTGTGVLTALGINIGSAGAPVTFNGAGGTPSSLTLTNATGLPVGSITGLGTGVATALAINVGSAGAFVVNGGALGAPSSGTVTNLTGTASININGTVGATTPTTIAGTTFAASSNATIAGYLRVGSASVPTNTTAGDLTVTRLSIGNGSLPGIGGLMRVEGNATGVIDAYAQYFAPTFLSDVTDVGYGILAIPSTQSAVFTLSNIRYFAATQGTIGAGSIVTTQAGFYATSTLTGATNNYGMYSDIAAASGRWNFYANGTAANYFAGSITAGTKILAGGSAPALTSCGTSPAITGSDLAGEVTMGTTAIGCIITFNAAYVSTPYCTVSWQATPLASQSYVVSNTAITTTQTSTSNNKLNYTCMARSDG